VLNPFSRLSIAAVLAVFAATASPAFAVRDSETTGLFGVTAGQVVRVNVVLLDEMPASSREPGPALFAVEIVLYGPAGEVLIRQSEPAAPPDHPAVALERRAADLFPQLRAGERAYLRAEVRLLGGPDTAPGGETGIIIIGGLVSVEVIDEETGRTALFVPPAQVKRFNPQPDPPAAR
jgi:hypothetical protein